jgi:hypothetical protein
MPGARVRFYRAGQVGGRALLEGRTDARGGLALAAGSDGSRLVAVVEAAGHAPAAVPYAGERAELELADLELVPGQVVGPSGEGVAAQVRLLAGAFVLSEAVAEASGAFLLRWPGGDAGELIVELSAEGYHPTRLLVRDAADSESLLVRLQRGDTGAVDGVVVDGHGAPLPEVLVRARTSESVTAAAQTDVDGRFRFEGLRTGPVDLEVYLQAEVPVTLATVTVEGGAAAPVRIVASAPGSLQVAVIEPTGDLEGIEVRIVDPTTTRYGGFSKSGVEQRQSTDATGQARFELPAGRYYVRVRHRDQEASAEALVESGRQARVEVDLGEARRLRVRVVDLQGNPVSGVFMDVSMPSIQWQSMPSGTTGADGVVEFPALPEGLAGVHLGKGGQWRMVYTAAEEAELVWTEASRLLLLGTAEVEDGELLAASVLPDSVKTETLLVSAGLVEATLTPPDGARDVYLLAPDAGLAPAFVGHASLGQPELVGLEVRFEQGATVRGKMVQGPTGVPGEVRVEGALGGVLEARAQWLGGTDHDPWITVNEWGQSSGADGSFEIAGLPPGSHRVALRGVGCTPRTLDVVVEAGQRVELGEVTLEAAD